MENNETTCRKIIVDTRKETKVNSHKGAYPSRAYTVMTIRKNHALNPKW
jgi:hypothetical protein